ncbi:hypothetical protein HY837_04200 [archaeon]|nr:hypothetical protein [archaeon]
MNLLFLGKRAKIERAIAEGELDMAEGILNVYVTDVFKSEYHVARLRVLIDREKAKQKIERLTDNYQLEEARKSLEEMKKEPLLTKEELKNLENKVNSITEEGMLSRIEKTKGAEKISLTEKYLMIYPEGKNRELVLQELLVEEFCKFADYLKTNQEFEQFYEQIKNLNITLEKYAEEKINLTERLPLNGIIEKVKETAKKLYGGEEDSDITAGSWVKTLAVKNIRGFSWDKEYKSQRDATFPIGSVGKVLTIITDYYIIEFEGINKYTWENNWEIVKAFWEKNGKRNVGAYSITELTPVKLLNEVDNHKLRKEVERLENRIKNNYSSSQEKPVKKRHNPEITEKDKVTPRSDYDTGRVMW